MPIRELPNGVVTPLHTIHRPGHHRSEQVVTMPRCAHVDRRNSSERWRRSQLLRQSDGSNAFARRVPLRSSQNLQFL